MTKCKNILPLCIGLLVIVQAYAEAETTMILSGGSTGARPPYRWYDKCTGELTGSIPHLLKKIFSQLDIKFRYTAPMEYQRNLTELLTQQVVSGEIDARVAYMNNSIDSGAIYSYHPLMTLKLAAFYPTTRDAISSAKELRAMRGIVVSPMRKETRHSPPQNYLRQRNYPFVLAASYDEALDMVLRGEGDYVFGLKYNELLIKKNSLQYMEVEEAVSSFHLEVGETSSFAGKVPEIDQKLGEAISSGLVDFLDRKYLMLWMESRSDCK